MSRTDKRRSRRRLKRKIQRCLAICILFALEVGGAMLAGGLTALVMVPIAYAQRGYLAFGGEIMAVFAVTVIAYFIIHNRIFRELEEPQKGVCK